MHGIARDVYLGFASAVLAAFFVAMAWAGVMIAVIEPGYRARHRRGR